MNKPPSEYQPLAIGDDEYGVTDFNFKDAEKTRSNVPSDASKWTTVILSLLFFLSAVATYVSLPFGVPEHARLRDLNLRHPDPCPNLSVAKSIYKSPKSPRMLFPSAIVRTNRQMPDVVYGKSPHVFLDSQHSMFYQFHLQKDQPLDSCYIAAPVPSPEALAASTKSYNASGALGAIQVWNVTRPASMDELSWSTRPSRISLLGTINFTSINEPDGWQLGPPTPRFSCIQGEHYTIEVACDACHIEFDQIFSMPALGFDLQQLG